MATKTLTVGFCIPVSASGRETSMPACLMKVAVTMKKISMMNTTSSMGVKLMSDSSSERENGLLGGPFQSPPDNSPSFTRPQPTTQ